MQSTTPTKLSAVPMMISVISGVVDFTNEPVRTIHHTINLPVARRSSINSNGDHVCVPKMVESHDETDSSISSDPIDLEKEISATENNVAASDTIDFALKKFQSANATSTSVGTTTKVRALLAGTLADVQNAEDDVNDYINDLISGTQTTTQVWNELQGPNGRYAAWYDLGADMVTDAPNGTQPIKLAKAGRVVQNTCSANNGQPVPSYADLMTILLTLDLAFENYQQWY